MASFTESFQMHILPVIAVFSVYNMVGFIGNITVLYVYAFRYNKNRFRCLVLALSIIDFTSCCSTIPLETISTWLWFQYPSRVLCKAKNFFVQFTALSAVYMLFVTAVYKYRQICRPFGKQATQSTIVISCICGMVISLILATPAPILWDINNNTVTFNNESEAVFICEVRIEFHNSIYPALYRHFLSAYTIFLLATVILYIFVARTTIQHFRRLQRQPSTVTIFDNPVFSVGLNGIQNKNYKCSTEHTKGKIPVSEMRARTNNHREHANHVGNHTSETTKDYKTPSTDCLRQQPGATMPLSVLKTMHKASPKTQLTSGRIRKVAIMVIIAGLYSVTFFMALGFGYVFAVRVFDDFESIGDLVMLFCFYRLYFINYALNPVVYFVLDGQFRKEAIKLYTLR